jgi:hypothetical protein
MPTLSLDQVHLHLSHHFGIREGDIQVKKYGRADFLLIFASMQLADMCFMPPLPNRRISR